MVASSISAVLTYLFGVGVPAPHGGFLVLPVVINPLLWVAAILTGSLVGGFAYGFWKNRTADNTEVENIIDDNIDAMGPTSITTS
jgi:PTS system fructose-specific IIC component